jgi:hypothetical protein
VFAVSQKAACLLCAKKLPGHSLLMLAYTLHESVASTSALSTRLATE